MRKTEHRVRLQMTPDKVYLTNPRLLVVTIWPHGLFVFNIEYRNFMLIN
jgi:hypothetical protein